MKLAPPLSAFRVRTARSREVGLSVVLTIQAAIMFVIAPLAATHVVSPVTIEIFRVGLTAAAVILLTRNRLVAGAIVAAFLASLVLSIVARPGVGTIATAYVRIAASGAFDGIIAVVVFRIVFGPGRVTIHRIMGAVIFYLSIGLVFASFYRAAALSLTPSFNGLSTLPGAGLSQLLYFSLTTLTTTGYGDITPVHPFVRSLANLEAVIGQLFPATLLARLVTLHAAGSSAEPAERRSDEGRSRHEMAACEAVAVR